MSLIGLLLTLIVIGVVIWTVTTYIPMDAGIKRLIQIVAVIVAVIYVLNAFGILAHFGHLSVPQIK